MNNLFSNIPSDLPDEVVEILLKTKSLRIERIVSHGHASANDFWYDQHQHEWVLLLQGEAKLQFEDDTELLSMKPGDCVNIPAGRRHRVEWTTLAESTGDSLCGGEGIVIGVGAIPENSKRFSGDAVDLATMPDRPRSPRPWRR